MLLNYNSQDGLHEWIRQFGSAIEAGTLRYVHERSDPHFHTTKAKNLAHFAATGEYVVNLDGDNFIGDTIARYRKFWRKHPDLVIQGWCGTNGDGTFGRVGMAKRHFLALGGYDEEMLSGAIDDLDLIRRAEARKFRVINLAQLGVAAIRNDKSEQIRYAAKKESGAIFKFMTKPGLWLQNITTQEPDAEQLEVAIKALDESLKLEPAT